MTAPGRLRPAELQAVLAAERRLSPFLLLRDAQGELMVRDLGEEPERLSVGRSPGAGMHLAWDPKVSRVHVQLERAGQDWVAVDDGTSSNGTYVNGVRLVGGRRLEDGDTLRCGDTSIVYRRPAASSDETVPDDDLPRVEDLTAQQLRVVAELCRPLLEGTGVSPATNADIAARLHLTVEAVKAHLREAGRRLGHADAPQNEKRARMAETAMRWGIVSPRDL